MSYASSKKPFPPPLVYYQHHITPTWLLANVCELPDFEHPGIMISHDLQKLSYSTCNSNFSDKGRILVKNMTKNRSLWFDYLIVEMLTPNPLPQGAIYEKIQNQQLELLNGLVLSDFTIEFDETLYYFENTSIQNIMDDHLYGNILMPRVWMQELSIHEKDTVLLRMDRIEASDPEIIKKLAEHCL